jgi:cation diffusion facilitator CzcD-associated flavoprotein CzcO
MANKKIVIIGAGPTGLGAAYRLNELGYDNWVLYENPKTLAGIPPRTSIRRDLSGMRAGTSSFRTILISIS